MSTATAAAIAIPPILGACCLDGHRRFDLSMPWFADEHLWASDGWILVRAPADALDPAARGAYSPGRRRLPIVYPMFLAKVAAGFCDPVPLPVGIPGGRRCHDCRGDGLPDEDGARMCPTCDGSGSVPNDDRIRAGPVVLQARYVALLVAHGVTHVRPASHPIRPVDQDPAYFAGPGFDGLLMPMT